MEYSSNGGDSKFGALDPAWVTLTNPSGIHWYHVYDPNNLYRGGNVPNNCYVQNWGGGQYGLCGIVYDALGGSRRAYTVRTGFWDNHNGQGYSGWAWNTGPTSALGMPITNEYETDPGYVARQDFVGGWLNWVGGVSAFHTWNVCSPGWTVDGWNPQVSYRIAEVYDANGKSLHYGEPTSLAYHDANGWHQNFQYYGPIDVPDSYGSGGPDLARIGLVLRNPAEGKWWVRVSDGSAFVYPSGPNTPPDLWLAGWAIDGNEGYTYTPYVGDPDGDGYDDLLVWRNDAKFYVAWNNEDGSFADQGAPIHPEWGTGAYEGRYFHFFVDLTGDGRDELVTYDAPYAYWQVCIFNSGTNLYEYAGNWLTWGGGVGVFQPLVGDWNGDGKSDLCLRNWATGDHWVRISTGSGFEQPNPDNWEPAWGADASPTTFVPLAGDWNGDGKDDILLFNQGIGSWWVRTSTGTDFVYPEGSNTPPDLWLSGWTGSGYLPFVGDFDFDGDMDIGLRNPALGDHWVRLSTGLAFTMGANNNWCPGWGAQPSFQLRVADLGSGPGSPPQSPPPGGGGKDPGFEGAPPIEEPEERYVFETSFAPNPFNPTVTITYTLPEASHVRLDVFDVTGKHLATLIDRTEDIGEHVVRWDASGFASGVYFYRLNAGSNTATRKMVLLQ